MTGYLVQLRKKCQHSKVNNEKNVSSEGVNLMFRCWSLAYITWVKAYNFIQQSTLYSLTSRSHSPTNT